MLSDSQTSKIKKMHQYSAQNTKTYTCKILLYLLINLLFLYKYGLRQHIINVYLLMTIYVLSLSLFGWFFLNTKIQFRNFKTIFIFSILIIGVLMFGINNLIDGHLLNNDRWSAMDVAIKALYNGEYPYTAVDHLNGRTSNFPSLLLIGTPFYLLGDVGYLQICTFFIFAATCYYIAKTQKQILIPILFLLLSPCYWYEIAAKSDLMSNIIIVLCFIILWQKKIKKNIFELPKTLGFSTAFLLLTRGIVAIPLILFLFKDFFKTAVKTKIIYITSFIITISMLIFMVIMNAPSLYILKNYNPLILQTQYLASYLHFIILILPFYFSFKINEFKDLYKYSIILISIPVLISFIIIFHNFGFNEIIQNSPFDLSYFGMILPILAISIMTDFDKLNIK